jgi:hypothetical protein
MSDQTVPTGPDARDLVEAAIGQTLATFDDTYVAVGSIGDPVQRVRVRGAVVGANMSLIEALHYLAGEDPDDETPNDLAERMHRLESEVSLHSQALAGLMRVVYVDGGRS